MGNATRTAFTTTDYRNALAGKGPLALEWADKPHRLIYDLCKSVEWWEAQSLARESEHTTLVTPEWLDGAEAKRLGFARRLPNHQPEWVCNSGEADGVTVILDGQSRHSRWTVWFGGEGTGRAGVPTIAQVRAAVFLATGRRKP